MVPNAGHLEQFASLERKVDRAVWVFAIAVNVEAIHGAVPIKEGVILFQYLVSNSVQRSSIRQRCKELVRENRRCEFYVALCGEVDPIDRVG